MITLCCVDRLQTNFRHQKRVSALELMISYMWSYFYRVHFYWVIFSLLNTIIEGNFEVIKTVNLLYQNGSLSKDIKLTFDMYLQPCVWYSGQGIIGMNDKKEMCTLYNQNRS